MASYPELATLFRAHPVSAPHSAFLQNVLPYLIDVWLDDYERSTPASNTVVVTPDNFSYLFDIAEGRLLAAWGVTAGKNTSARPASRMQGHPLSAGALYHRGHAIPHTLGGACDINLVPQLGRINIGPFRTLEIRAVATPGAFYFTYWDYNGTAPATQGHPGQTPTHVDQGLLVDGHFPEITRHVN